MTKLITLIKQKSLFLIIAGIFLVFFALSFKDPYSERSLIPNLEPFPDTLFYSIPAMNLAKGDGFSMQSYDHNIKSMVPPLYSLYLIPFFAINNDIRSFYLANQILSFMSLSIFLLITYNLTKSKKEKFTSIAIGGFLYITTFHLYNLPSLLMAENLTLLLSLVSFYLIFSKLSTNKVIIASYIGLLLLLTKFSNFPIALAFHLVFIGKVFVTKNKKFVFNHILNLCLAILSFLLFVINSKILSGHINLSSDSGFSSKYAIKNINFYIKSLFGNNTIFLWYQEYLFNKIIAILGLIGLIWSYIKNYSRANILMMTIYSVCVILFMSFFYYSDARYILPLVLIPIWGATFLIHQIYSIKKSSITLVLCLTVVCLIKLVFTQQNPIINKPSLISLKNQLSINFKYQETPWNFVAVQHFNKHINNKSAYLATFLPPFYIEIFSHNNYQFLPLNEKQEFSAPGKDILQYFYQGKLTDHYKNLLNKGHKIYISNYYSHSFGWEEKYSNLKNLFNVELVSEGCHSTCNLYQLTNKNSEQYEN